MKKRNPLVFTLCLLGLLAVLPACKKSTPKTKTEIISRTWKVQKAEGNPGGVLFQEGATTNPVNYAPFRVSFNPTSFNWVDNQGQATSGTWKFEQNETVIKFTASGNPNFKPAQVNVTQLDESTLVIRFTQVNSKGQSTDYTLTLVPAG